MKKSRPLRNWTDNDKRRHRDAARFGEAVELGDQFILDFRLVHLPPGCGSAGEIPVGNSLTKNSRRETTRHGKEERLRERGQGSGSDRRGRRVVGVIFS